MHVQQALDVVKQLSYTPVDTHTHTHSTLSLKHSTLHTATRNICTLTQAMKAQKKRRLAGPTTGCCTTKDTCIEVNGELGRQLSGALRKAHKQKTNTYIHTHTQVCMFVCMIV